MALSVLGPMSDLVLLLRYFGPPRCSEEISWPEPQMRALEACAQLELVQVSTMEVRPGSVREIRDPVDDGDTKLLAGHQSLIAVQDDIVLVEDDGQKQAAPFLD